MSGRVLSIEGEWLVSMLLWPLGMGLGSGVWNLGRTRGAISLGVRQSLSNIVAS